MYRLDQFDSNWELTTHLQILNNQGNDAFHEYFVLITGHEWRGKRRSLLEFSHSSNDCAFFHLIFIHHQKHFPLWTFFKLFFTHVFELLTSIQRNFSIFTMKPFLHANFIHLIFPHLTVTSQYFVLAMWCSWMNSFFMYESTLLFTIISILSHLFDSLNF